MKTDAADQPMKVGEYLDAWLDHARGRVRVRTWEGYECLIRVNAKPVLGEKALSELHALDLQRLYGSLLKKGLAGGTVLNLHLVLTQALSQAVRWGYLAANPAARAQAPRPHRKELVVLDLAATAAILGAAAGTRMEASVGLAIATGMRRGELLGLRWSDLDAEFTVAHVARTLQATKQGIVFERPKTPRSRRNVALPEFCVAYLRRQKADQDRRKKLAGNSWNENGIVIDYRNGEPWNPWSFAPAWSAFLRKSELPHVRFHDLRHAHATLMLSQGVHPKIVSERLGHASIGITLDTYSHVLPSMQQDAADAFDELFPSRSGEVAGSLPGTLL